MDETSDGEIRLVNVSKESGRVAGGTTMWVEIAKGVVAIAVLCRGRFVCLLTKAALGQSMAIPTAMPH